jgi:hypothetical protein
MISLKMDVVNYHDPATPLLGSKPYLIVELPLLRRKVLVMEDEKFL